MNSPRFKKIITLALPIIGAMTSQNILNLVDTAMVGALGPSALAAVGFCSFINFMAFALLTGLATGVQAISARRYGENAQGQTALPLNAGLFLAALFGIPLTIILYLLSPWLLHTLLNDEKVIAEGIPYLQIRLLSIAAIGMNFSFRGYWNATDRSKYYLYSILTIHICNVIISYILIFGKLGFPALGTAGAAIGTSISIILGTVIYVFIAARHARIAGFFQRLPTLHEFRDLLAISLPSSIQQFLFAAGMASLFWIVARVGTAEMAVANVLINITLVALLPAIGLGLASASLVGQALGKNNPQDAHAWAWDVVKTGTLLFSTIGLITIFFPERILSGFLHEPELIAMAKLPLQIVGVGIFIDGIGAILMHSLLGAGASRTVMWVSSGFQWFIFLPLAWVLGPILGFGLLAIWLAFVGYRSVQSVVFAALWQQKAWQHIRL